MKKVFILFFLFIAPSLFPMDNLRNKKSPAVVPTLRQLCINKIACLAQIDEGYNADSLVGIPHDIAHSLVEKLQEQLCTTRRIATLPNNGKISPNGSQILIIPKENQHRPLRVFDTATGAYSHTLEDSNGALFIPIKWSTTGKYIYANYNTSNYLEYNYKVWESKTGKKLYDFPFQPCGKLYFSPNDKWLIIKRAHQPLEICDAATGQHVKTLGEAHFSYSQYPQDPQNEWLTVRSPENTQLHNAQSFTLVKTLVGWLEAFNSDGTLLAIKKESENTVSIYNRLFELLVTFPKTSVFKGYFITNAAETIFAQSNFSDEMHYSLETGQETKRLKHPSDSDIYPTVTFSNSTGNGIIVLERTGKKTDIIIQHEDIVRKIECPNRITHIIYTKKPHLVALCDYTKVHYFLNLKIGVLIPCQLIIKNSGFNYKPLSQISSNGYFVHQNGDSFELHQLQCDKKLAPIMAMLTKKLELA